MTRELGEMLDPRIMLKVQVLSGLASGTCKAPNSMFQMSLWRLAQNSLRLRCNVLDAMYFGKASFPEC